MATSARAQEPERVTACQLESDPATYNHQLVVVTTFVRHAHTDFELYDPVCPGSGRSVWVEYGGTVSSGTMSSVRTRPSELAVESVPIPLIDDAAFRDFDSYVERSPDSVTHATMLGRFFSGRLDPDLKTVAGMGYGPMACCSLLAIDQIVDVDPETRTDLDYRATADEPNMESGAGCGVRNLRYGHADTELIDAQRRAEAGEPAFAFDDPDRMGAGTLASLLQIDPGEVTHFKRKQEAQGRVIYEWNRHGDTPDSYVVVVSKPYWLSFYAKDPKRVAWVVIAAYESSCGLVKEKKKKSH